ncbi:MAG: DMT family transporter [Synergistaceae bacterium]|jgi:drug/metabolite transporter (DMT)-like permease|nr:DMT family transporter [Synergistaceae bacterium]
MDKKYGSGLLPVLVLSIGVMCISSGSVFVRIAQAPPLVKSAYRVGISSLVLIPLAIVFRRDELKNVTRRGLLLSVVSGAFLSMHFAAWTASLDYTSVASSVILVNTIPIWIALAEAALGKTRPSRNMRLCVCLSVLGAAIIGYGDISFDSRALFGDALALLGAIAAAVYILCGREVRAKLGLLSYAALCYGFSAAFLWAAVLVVGYPVSGYSQATWGAMIAMAFMSQIIGHSSYNWALGHFSAGFVGIMLLGEPIGSSILAYLLFREVPAPAKFIGFALLLASIVLAFSDEGNRQDG